MRSLEQWLAYQAQVHPQAIDLGLDRLQTVLERLQWRKPQIPVITIAGTNGKGSVSAYCASILRAANYRVGTFTSPHLRDYRERIHVHDRLAHPAELIEAFERIEIARGSAAYSQVMDTKGPLMARREFAKPSSRVDQSYKDFSLMLECAQTLGQQLPFAEVYAELLRNCMEEGEAQWDNAAILAAIARRVTN